MNIIKIKIVFFLLLTGLSFDFSCAFAQEENNSLLDQINAVRKSPFSYALELGYSQAMLSEKGITESTSFASYEIDTFLNTLSYQLNQSIMGVETAPEKQIQISSRIYDTGGILEFSNYISMDRAEKIFINNILKNEIESGDFQYILSDNYTKAGVSIVPGTSQGGMNAWFLTLCVDPPVLIPEARLITLINQFRTDPWRVVKSNDIANNFSTDIDHSRSSTLFKRMPPVFLDLALLETTRIAVETGALGESSLDTSEIPGYDGTFLKSAWGTIQLEDYTQEQAIKNIFGKILEYELNNLQDNPGILNSDAEDIGLAVMTSQNQDNLSSMVFYVNAGIPTITGQENAYTENKIYGILYIDQDGDELYSPGEEVCGRDISIWEQTTDTTDENDVMITTITTDHVGRFLITLPSWKWYRFSCAPQNTDTKSSDLCRYLYEDLFVGLALPVSEE